MRNPRNDTLGSATTGKRDPSLRRAHADRGEGERRCVLSGTSSSRDELLRLAISPPDGEGRCDVLPDALARAPGRGAWIHASRSELDCAIENGRLKTALARAFKTGALRIPRNLPEMMENALKRAFLERLGLEMRSGRLILGSDRIANEARMGKVAALFHAADASPDGARKLDQAWRVGMDEEGSGLGGIFLPLDRVALSVALGRDNVVHLALADSASAQRVAIPLGRLQTFLGAADVAVKSGDVAADDAAREAAATD